MGERVTVSEVGPQFVQTRMPDEIKIDWVRAVAAAGPNGGALARAGAPSTFKAAA